MREIALVRLDQPRRDLVVPPYAARGSMTKVPVAPITSTIKGLATEGLLAPANGLDHECVAALDKGMP